MITNVGDGNFSFFFGIVEDILDPLQLGRVRVRIFGYQENLEIDDLNWATVMLPTTSASIGGIGSSPTGLLVGSYVIGFFMDDQEKQLPIILGTFCKIPEMDINKHDVNKLARGINTLNTDVVGPEPISTYAAQYPYNRVVQSKSGHIIEIDDTPDAERINIRHKSGTYTEISSTGKRVTKIIEDDIEVVIGNKTVFVKGDCNIEAEGNINIKVKGNCNIDTKNASIKSTGNINISGKKISLNG